MLKIVAITDGVAAIDTTGDGAPESTATLDALGITLGERTKLAALYAVGQSLFRVQVGHFSTWDANQGFSPPPGAKSGPAPDPKKPDVPNSCKAAGSIIECENQVLAEQLPVAGTPHAIRYQSDRVPGRLAAYEIWVTLSGATIPSTLKRIDLHVEVAGREYTTSYAAVANQSTTFTWDGLDAYGRRVQGMQKAKVRVDWVYDGVYTDVGPAGGFGYNGNGTVILSVPTRNEVMFPMRGDTTVGVLDARDIGLGGWALSAHQLYDTTTSTLFMGNGKRRVADALGTLVARTFHQTPAALAGPNSVVSAPDGNVYYDYDNSIYRLPRTGGTPVLIAGGGSSTADGVPATTAFLGLLARIARGADGSIYVTLRYGSDQYRLRRVRPDGVIVTVAGTSSPTNGDGGPAVSAALNYPFGIAISADGNVYVAEAGASKIRRIDPKGIISTFAGNGDGGNPFTTRGDGGRATAAQISPTDVALGPDGSLYATDSSFYHSLVRKITPDGMISSIAGKYGVGQRAPGADGVSATLTTLNYPSGLAVSPDGSVFISEEDFGYSRVSMIDPNGIIRTLLGRHPSDQGVRDEYPAKIAGLRTPRGISIAGDGTIYIADENQNCLRKVVSAMPSVSTSELVIPDESGAAVFVFDRAGRHLRTVDALTRAVLWTFGYDAAGRLVTVTDVDGNATTIERDAAGTPTAIVGPYGQRTELGVDGNGFLALVKDPANASTTFSYASSGLVATMTDPRAQTWRFTFDGSGRLTKDEDPAGGYQTLTRTASNGGKDWEVALATKLGRTKAFKVERLASGAEKRTFTSPWGLSSTSTESADGAMSLLRPTGMQSASTVAPDPRFGMLAKVGASSSTSTPAGLTQSTTFTRAVSLSNGSDPLSVTSMSDVTRINGGVAPSGATFTQAWSAATKTWTSTSATSPARTSTTTVDAKGHTVRTAHASLVPVDYGYDGRGRLQTITQGARTTTFGYGPDGYLATVTDPLLRTTTFEHDALGRVVKQTFPDLREVGMTYDGAGNLTSVTPPGRPTHGMTYSPVSLMSTYDPPALATVSAPSTSYDYDADRKLKTITRPDGVVVSYGYDTSGRRTSITHPHDTITFDYEPTKGTLTTVATPSVEMAYGYDGALRTSTTWSGAIAGSVGHTYDNRMRVATETVNGASSVTFGYDADGLLTSAGALSLGRGNHGMVTSTTLGAVTETVTYTTFGELESRTTKVSGTDLLKITYVRDGVGRIAQKTEVEDGVTTVYGYRYDDVGRLEELKKNGSVTASYGYDANGNRLTKTTTSGVESGMYDAQDRMLSYGGATYAYNANGDLTSKTDASGTTTYEYDALGNLRKVTPPTGSATEYVIDGSNRRVGKKVGGALTTQYVYASDLRIVAELDGAGAVVSRFVYGTRVNVPEYIVKGGSTYRVVTDHLGSVRKVVDTASGAVAQAIEYDEFGVVLSDSAPGGQPFGFAGGLADGASGFVRFGARDYQARAGRWTSKDPIGFDGGDTSLYGYVSSDPVNAFDPDGRLPWKFDWFVCEYFPSLCGGPPEIGVGADGKPEGKDLGKDLGGALDFTPLPPPGSGSDIGMCKENVEDDSDRDICREHFNRCMLSPLALKRTNFNTRCAACENACNARGGTWPKVVPGTKDSCNYQSR